ATPSLPVVTAATVTFGFTSPSPATAASYARCTSLEEASTKDTCERSPEASPEASAAAVGSGDGPSSPPPQPARTSARIGGTTSSNRRNDMAAILSTGGSAVAGRPP